MKEQRYAIGEERRALARERDAWENSEEVQALLQQRDVIRQQNGIFNGVLKQWQEQTPEWQNYLAQRRAFNERAAQLSEQENALGELEKQYEEKRVRLRQEAEQRAQDEYDSQMRSSEWGRKNTTGSWQCSSSARQTGMKAQDIFFRMEVCWISVGVRTKGDGRRITGKSEVYSALLKLAIIQKSPKE